MVRCLDSVIFILLTSYFGFETCFFFLPSFFFNPKEKKKKTKKGTDLLGALLSLPGVSNYLKRRKEEGGKGRTKKKGNDDDAERE